jgi:SSS family solute:Na+ symporter
LQNSVREAAGTLATLSPQTKEQATALLSQVSGSLDTMFSGQYGFLYQVASVNSYIFTGLLFLFCVVLVVVISLVTSKPTEKQLQYTILAATAEDKTKSRASWNKWDVIHTVIILGIVALFYFYFW